MMNVSLLGIVGDIVGDYVEDAWQVLGPGLAEE